MFVTRLVRTLIFPIKTFKIQIFTHQFKRKKKRKRNATIRGTIVILTNPARVFFSHYRTGR